MPPLPRRTRIAAIVLMILAGLVGLSAAQEVMVLANPSVLATAPTGSMGGLDAESARKFNQVLVGTLTSMRDSRMLVLGMLAAASALAVVAAGRLLRPAGISRESLRRMLAGSTIAAAIFRTIAGAQAAVAYRNAFSSVADAFVKIATQSGGQPPPDGFKEMIAPLTTAGVMGWTLVLVGFFLFTAQHFRSKSVREFVAASDAAQDG